MPLSRSSASAAAASAQTFGGFDDGTTSIVPALNAAAARLPLGAALRLPYGLTGTYSNPGPLNPGALLLDPDPTVTVVSAQMPYSDVKLTRALHFNISGNGAGQYTYRASADFNRADGDKHVFLGAADVDRTVTDSIVCNASPAQLTFQKIAWPSSDSWVTDTPASTTASAVSWSIAADGFFRGAFLPAMAGDEVTCTFPDATNFNRAVIIQATGGFHIVYVNQSGGAILAAKAVGAAVTNAALTWEAANEIQYAFDLSLISVRVIDQKTFCVLVGGMDVTGPVAALGTIARFGFGAYGIAPLSMSVTGWVRRRQAIYAGSQSGTLLVIGDSISDGAYHGQWPYYAREALNGTLGMRWTGIDNRAVVGETSAQQLARLQSVGVVAGNKAAVVAIGTNDIQGGVTVGAAGTSGSYIDNLNQIFTILKSAGLPVVCVPPPAFYNQSATPGGNRGQPTTTAGNGAPYRMAAIRLCADTGVRYVDPSQVDGVLKAAFLSGDIEAVDPGLRDNIHPTTFTSRNRALAIARAVAATVVPRPTKVLGYQALPLTYQNSWSTVSQIPGYKRNEAGAATLFGVIDKGSGPSADYTTIATLPAYLCPPATMQLAAACSTGFCQLEIDKDGSMKVVGWPSGATWVSLAGVRLDV